MLKIIIGWAIPFVLGGVATGTIAYIKALHKKESALEKGVQCLLRSEIIRLHKQYMELQRIPIYAKEAMVRAYSAYHDLKGDDVATGLYNEVMTLPVSDK